MRIIRLDTTAIHDWPSFHEEVASQFGFPDWYGENADAFWDCIMSLDEPGMSAHPVSPDETVLVEVFAGSDFARRCPEQARFLLAILGEAAAEYRKRGSSLQLVTKLQPSPGG